MGMDQTKYFISSSYVNPYVDPNDALRMPEYQAVNAMLGIGVGREWVSASNSTTYTCWGIQAIIDSTLSVLVDNTIKIVSSSGGLLTTLAISAGNVIYGNFTTCSVRTGVVCGFYKN